MSNRAYNERRFGQWTERPDGGREYWLDVAGRRAGWFARYVKVVDATERTLEFYQLIYDNLGRLRGIHRKFPVDEGHQLWRVVE